ncbi:MAG: HDIG domain-containing protein [Firmicutes bacterium]|nr:HDIG domain-containing protein [Bacillota bacterium]
MARQKSSTRFWQQWSTVFHRGTVRQWLLGLVVFVGLLGVLMIDLLPTGVSVEVGQVARRDIEAPRTAINSAETARLKEEAGRRALLDAYDNPDFYDINHATVVKVEENITAILNLLRASIPGEAGEGQEGSEALSVTEVDRRLIRDYGIDLPPANLGHIAELSLAEFDVFAQNVTDAILAQMNEEISEDGLRDAWDQYELRISARKMDPQLEHTAILLGRQLIQPNLVIDTNKANQAKEQAMAEVEPVTIVRGEIILRKGDVVREEHISVLQDLGLIKTGIDYLALMGLVILVALMVYGMAIFVYQNRPSIVESQGKIALLGIVILVVTLVGKILALIHWPLAPYLNPTAWAGLLLTLLVDSKLAAAAVTVLSMVLAVMNGFSLNIAFLALAGGLTAIVSITRVSQRGDLMRAGFVVGGINFASMVGLGLVQQEPSLIIHSYLGVLNGVLSSITAIGVLPYLESLFGITSAIRLLELSNPNHPLLRRMMVEAPGTYHHSILVGNLAEAAAEAIGADGLLARVGAHYHDIGKLKRPYFFVENQIGMDNPHDKMAPTLSTLIVTSHVKDGLELAREYKLPDAVTQFIAQHHGTDLVKYFYHRAMEANDSAVEEQEFRYPGPKPQSKEVAIVSLADATEAAVRSLSKPTPGKIEALVRKIIKDRLNSGELDQSDLTFQDLDKVANAFVKVIIGMFHARVEYPEEITKEDIEGKRNRGGSPPKQ